MKAKLFVFICGIFAMSTSSSFGQVGLLINDTFPDRKIGLGNGNSNNVEIAYFLTWTGLLNQNWHNAGSLPGGYRSSSGTFNYIQKFAGWWSSSVNRYRDCLKTILTIEKTEVQQRKQRNKYLISNPLFPLLII